MLWFNFILGLNFIWLCFKLIIIHYHTKKQKEIKFKLRVNLNHNILLMLFANFFKKLKCICIEYIIYNIHVFLYNFIIIIVTIFESYFSVTPDKSWPKPNFHYSLTSPVGGMPSLNKCKW